MIRQAGLTIHECPHHATEQADGEPDDVVEIVSKCEDLSLDQWSDWIHLVKQTYFDPSFIYSVGSKFRKRM